MERSALPLETFRALRRLTLLFRTNLPKSSRADYEFAVLQLRKAAVLIAHAGAQPEVGMLMFFPYVLPEHILSDIRRKNPYAMVLLSFFALLLSTFELHFWYLQGWSERLLKAIEPHVRPHPELWMMTKWPRQQVNKVRR